MPLIDDDLGFEALVVIGPLLVEQDVDRRRVELLLGVLLEQGFVVAVRLFRIDLRRCRVAKFRRMKSRAVSKPLSM